MKSAWAVLLVSAFTDFVITAGTSLMTAMMASGDAELPRHAVMLVAGIGGVVAAARTIQQALKATPETVKQLKGATS
jgi:hypothetical protein